MTVVTVITEVTLVTLVKEMSTKPKVTVKKRYTDNVQFKKILGRRTLLKFSLRAEMQNVTSDHMFFLVYALNTAIHTLFSAILWVW